MEVKITYKNYKGEVSVRRIMPRSIWWGKNEWHPEEQWFLDALDIEKDAERSFALKDIQNWK